MNRVTETPFADCSEVERRYARRLGFETDCSDVLMAMKDGNPGFVLLDVRSPDLFGISHVPGAVNLPAGKIIESKMAQWPKDMPFVVYCAGPHCNGTDKAAIRLARLGRKVKVMIGGMTGWADEGYEFASGGATVAVA